MKPVAAARLRSERYHHRNPISIIAIRSLDLRPTSTPNFKSELFDGKTEDSDGFTSSIGISISILSLLIHVPNYLKFDVYDLAFYYSL
ncbi:hypothetical protein PRUPE_8G068500 [Prunus persica]|uniref:Uncharacterized protein n=1 Tax=Prunus persica TaxID=3760 RepID=A0A251MUA6_PRUPE|nr:hypothetical protein PRUPE_8G068500 [Prunus persica]